MITMCLFKLMSLAVRFFVALMSPFLCLALVLANRPFNLLLGERDWDDRSVVDDRSDAAAGVLRTTLTGNMRLSIVTSRHPKPRSMAQ